jgi:hypothetical protein
MAPLAKCDRSDRAPIAPDDLRAGRAAAPLSNLEIDQIDTVPRRS